MSKAPDDNLAEKQVFTTGEAAQLCNVSQQTIIRCFDSGRLTGFKVPGSKFRRIPRDELIRFMKENGISTESLGARRLRVLMISDDPGAVEALRGAAVREGRFEVFSATNGLDAGILLESLRPDLVVIDRRAADPDPILVCQRIQARESLRGCRIVAIIGPDAPAEALRRAGVEELLRTPVRAEAVLAKIAELLGTNRDS
jgi:excisionase family DNA binding protein